jgi:hypothetical protein
MAINPLQAPVNYMAMTPQVDLGRSFSELGQVLAQRQQQQQAQEVKQQFANDLQAAQADGSQKAWLGMIAKYPQFREAFGDVRKGVGEERLKNEFTQGFEISNAMEAKDFPAAINRTKLLIEAKKNSGEPTKIYEDVLGALERGDFAAAQSGANLSLAVLDPDRYEKSVKARTTATKAPEELRTAVAAADKAVADATTAQATAKNAPEKAAADAALSTANAQKAAVAAKFAESNAVIDLQKKGWDITKIQNDIDIAKQNSRIAAINAATAKEGNSLKRQENELKLREMIDKRDATVREKVAEVESARSDMDNFLNTADRILKTPKNIVGSAAGPISARMPTLSQDTADFEALVETLGSQAFMSQIPKMKGAGALSEKEGDKLQSSLQNLSLKQSPERLIENVKEAQRLILKGRATLAKRSGLPESIPDTPSVQTSPGDIDALLKKYGGK